VREIANRLEFLVNVGLDYLALERSAETLSERGAAHTAGEPDRLRPHRVMYVLDEPSIGLHQRDNARLIETLKRLRDLGNSVIVVEHDADAIRAADHVVDMGPGAARPADISSPKASSRNHFESPVAHRRYLAAR